ncbi:efflux RND transporter periplasmic adaptor subunit [Nitratireductor sp. XY-223]|uniref:efflux RND transporter periplasmic adaptor subunit n=1 Tax=Nitratireductor sp. XY-223 TaxID=2561926 RepID=UPI0010AAB0B0|nr:efflux RND transporter periplasmic adaptor subunit [Nitratireductor sp. XY-223]
MAFWKQAVISLILLMVFAIGFALFSYGPGAVPGLSSGAATAGIPGGGQAGVRERLAPLVVLSTVETATTDDMVKSVGTARAIERATLYPEVAGRVSQVNAASGARVEQGDVIVQLDDQVQRLAVDRASLAVEDSEAQLQRFETLAARNTVSDVQLSDAALALSNARLDLREAEDALARRTVIAPFSGEVGLIDVGVGDYVTTATPVTTLDERETLLIEFRVPERFANQIAHGQPMTLSTPALPGLVLDGAISGMDSRIDTVSRTLTVQGTIANQDDLIRPGMSFEVSLSFAGNSYPSVPSLAVQWDRDGSYVFKANGNTAERTAISIVARKDGQVLVDGEIAAGDSVVSEGTNAVRTDQPFRTPSETPAPATGA